MLFPVNTMMPEFDLDDTEGLDPSEVQYLSKFRKWQGNGTAYAMENGTRPATIGLAMSASPLALLAWIGEKYLEWSDTDLPLDTILLFTSLYWFTSSAPRNVWPYRSTLPGSAKPPAPPMSETKPVGYSAFRDIYVLPKAWTKRYPMIKFRREQDVVSLRPLQPELKLSFLALSLQDLSTRAGTLLLWSNRKLFSRMFRNLYWMLLVPCEK